MIFSLIMMWIFKLVQLEKNWDSFNILVYYIMQPHLEVKISYHNRSEIINLELRTANMSLLEERPTGRKRCEIESAGLS